MKPEGWAELPQKTISQISQAFYNGMACCCLNQAWQALDGHREDMVVERSFRGTITERRTVPFQLLGLWLGRSAGTVSRWFGGGDGSAVFANLAATMHVLNADWGHLGSLPPKRDRRRAGVEQSLKWIASKILRLDPVPPLTTEMITHLECLRNEATKWLIARRTPSRREQFIQQVSEKYNLNNERLEETERLWGDASLVFVRFFRATAGARLWL